MADDSRNNGKKTGPGNPPVEHQFKPGNPGKQRGSRNKLGEQFLDDLLASWESSGAEAIQRVILSKPDAYLRVVASLMPKDLNVNINQIESMTDEQLVERIRRLDAAIAPFLDAKGTDRSGGGDRAETAH